jgi:hypothetical protein
MMPQPFLNQNGKPGACGCGRSLTGQCCGWHALTNDVYLEKLNAYLRDVAEESKEQND